MMERELGEGFSFTKKKCFVCGSLSHLIKDCDYYEKKKAREAEDKRVINTGIEMEKPVWTNANRVNHSNKFVPRSVQLNAGRPNINSVRPNINTGRTNINSVRPRVNAVNTVRSKQPVPTKTSNIMGNWGSDVKTSASYNWRNYRLNSNCDSGPTFIRTVNAKSTGRPKLLKAWFNPSGQEHHTVAQSQPLSSTLPTPPTPTPTSIHASIPTPTPIPETEPEPIEHTFKEPSPAHQHFSPPQEQAQGQMTVDDLLQVVPQLMSRIDSLETDLKQTKLTMGNAIVKLVKKVKKLEGFLKRRNVILSDSEEEETEAQGRKSQSQDDPLVSLVHGLITPSKTTVKASGEEQVEDISPNTLEVAKTLSRVASLSYLSIVKGREIYEKKRN
ncbi:hypothetical protein Tco_1076402 [Tanacetum coccineum]